MEILVPGENSHGSEKKINKLNLHTAPSWTPDPGHIGALPIAATLLILY